MSDHGYCNLCEPPRRIALDALSEHFHVVHDLTLEVATWPDGSPVVIDQTLEPCDFEEDRS